MQKISFIFQIVFKLALIFLIVFIWVRYFVHSLLYSVLISAAITAIVDIITRLIFRKRNSVRALKAAEREEAENAFLSLSLDAHALDFLTKLALKKHVAVKKKDCVLITHEEGEKVLLQPIFAHRDLTPDDIAALSMKAKKLGAEKIVVLCKSASKECYSFAKNFDAEFVILDQYEAYQKLYVAYDFKPQIIMKYKKEKALAFKDLAMYSLNRSRAKGYFFSALVLVISSLFVRATIYYCIVASLLIVLAIISLTNPFAKNKNIGSIL